MNDKSGLRYLIPGLVLYILIPFLYLLLGDFPVRTVLKEAMSFLTIGAFFLMLGQFYLTRINKIILKGQKMSSVINLHKVLGYIFIPVLILHPFLIVVPRFFESGVEPAEALKTILTTFGSRGIVIGFIAMVLMILLGITSMFRKKLLMKYTTWRTFHGILSIAFVILATWHAVNLGRHADFILSTYMIIMSSIGVLLLIRMYFFVPETEGEKK